MHHLKKSLLLFLFSLPFFAHAQQQKIVEILNEQLQKEVKRQFESPHFNGDTLVVVKPFKIENNILSVSIKKKEYYPDNYYTETQSVALNKITSLVKDINIIFETESDAIQITDVSDKETSNRKYDLFFVHLRSEKQNEYLQDELIKAFKKAGYSIKKGIWAD